MPPLGGGMEKTMYNQSSNLKRKFIFRFLCLLILLSLAIPKTISAKESNYNINITPAFTIEYLKNLWEAEPNVIIFESTSKSFIFEFNGILTEYYEKTNSKKMQEIIVVENGKKNTIKKDLTTGSLYIDNVLITVSNNNSLISLKEALTVYSDSWSSPLGLKRYEVTWQKDLADLTVSALTTIIVGSIFNITGAIAGFIASAIIEKAFTFGGSYLNSKATFIEYYYQLSNDNTKYREVWNCYWDPDYSNFLEQYIVERVYGW